MIDTQDLERRLRETAALQIKPHSPMAGTVMVFVYDRAMRKLLTDAADTLAALRKDAERYRWLSRRCELHIPLPYASPNMLYRDDGQEEWDAAIDTAMRGGEDG